MKVKYLLCWRKNPSKPQTNHRLRSPKETVLNRECRNFLNVYRMNCSIEPRSCISENKNGSSAINLINSIELCKLKPSHSLLILQMAIDKRRLRKTDLEKKQAQIINEVIELNNEDTDIFTQLNQRISLVIGLIDNTLTLDKNLNTFQTINKVFSDLLLAMDNLVKVIFPSFKIEDYTALFSRPKTLEVITQILETKSRNKNTLIQNIFELNNKIDELKSINKASLVASNNLIENLKALLLKLQNLIIQKLNTEIKQNQNGEYYKTSCLQTSAKLQIFTSTIKEITDTTKSEEIKQIIQQAEQLIPTYREIFNQ